MSFRTSLFPLVVCWLSGLMVANGQRPVLWLNEQLDFDRPEAWAMKRSVALLLFTGMGPPEDREFGEMDFALEGIWNPELSVEESRVGFEGTKVEDLNRLAIIPRPRVSVGVGWDTVLDLAYIPPLKIDGIEPNIFAAALERPVFECGDWAVGLRLFGQVGEVRGDITCPEDEAAYPPGSTFNPFGCEFPSQDTVTLNYAGVALTGGYRLPECVGGAIHFGAYATYADLEFQVDAHTFGIHDVTRQEADGWIYALTLGYSRMLSEQVSMAVEGFYAPLEVMRGLPQGDMSTENDDLLNLRAMLRYRF